MERLETDPAKYLPEPSDEDTEAVRIDLNRSMDKIRAELARYPVATRLMLTGKIVVARDIAHAKLKERLDKGEGVITSYSIHYTKLYENYNLKQLRRW